MAIVHIAGACWPSLIPCRRDLDMSTIIAAPCRGGRGQAGGVFPAGRCARRSEADDGPDAHDQSREVRAANSSAAIVLNQDPVPGEARIPMRRFGRRQDTQMTRHRDLRQIDVPQRSTAAKRPHTRFFKKSDQSHAPTNRCHARLRGSNSCSHAMSHTPFAACSALATMPRQSQLCPRALLSNQKMGLRATPSKIRCGWHPRRGVSCN